MTVNDAETVAYDKLLIATGSRPYIPPSIKGTDAPGVYALRTLADARSMAERVNVARNAIMAGGGMLNLKDGLCAAGAGTDGDAGRHVAGGALPGHGAGRRGPHPRRSGTGRPAHPHRPQHRRRSSPDRMA